MSRSIRDARFAMEATAGDYDLFRETQREIMALAKQVEGLERMGLESAKPVLMELYEDVMAALREENDINAVLRLQGEARAYWTMTKKPEELRELLEQKQIEAAELRERLERAAADAGEGNATP